MDLAEALENLSRHGPAEAQQKAIAWLTSREDYDLHLLIQTDGKSHWENAAKVLRQKGAAKTMGIIDHLLEWIQDINWPGSQDIMALLETFPKPIFLPAYEKAVSIAAETNDDPWLDYLSYFLRIGYVQTADFSNTRTASLLFRHMKIWE